MEDDVLNRGTKGDEVGTKPTELCVPQFWSCTLIEEKEKKHSGVLFYATVCVYPVRVESVATYRR
jgi:hypothetical protein